MSRKNSARLALAIIAIAFVVIAAIICPSVLVGLGALAFAILLGWLLSEAFDGGS